VATIYLDESGDLGWNFSAPYRAGGSSRYLTIAAVFTPDTHAHQPARVIRDMYTERAWSTAKEKKWSDMSDGARLDFATKAAKLAQRQPEIKYFAMVVNKQRVQSHLQADPNLLYNYMLRLLLIDEMAAHEHVLLVPDPRSIKVASGNSQHEYLQTTLWYDKGVTTKLSSRPVDSKKELGIQFADMVSGVVQAHHEDGRSKPWLAMAAHVKLKALFF
jgi:Protein of unknown function (DUF3800)